MSEAIGQNLNLGQVFPQSTADNFVDQAVLQFAQQLLSYGECLSYAKYANYVPGAPKALNYKALTFAGDTCKLVNAGLKIQSRVNDILSDHCSSEEKAKKLLEVAQITMKLANTQFIDYLPENAANALKKMSAAFGVVDLGLDCKIKINEASTVEKEGLGSTLDKIEASRLAFQTANAALNAAGVGMFSPLKVGVTIGSGLLTAAKVGTTAAHAGWMAGKFINHSLTKVSGK